LGSVYIAIGNSLRGDDGAAQRVLNSIDAAAGSRRISVLQLTPEIAAEIAGAQTVIFIDASVGEEQPRVERIEAGGRSTPLAHAMSPAEVVCLAQRLYTFAGEAFLCRLPASSFHDAERLSPFAEEGARAACALLQRAFQVG
jgi:hydrogenase maturation protease